MRATWKRSECEGETPKNRPAPAPADPSLAALDPHVLHTRSRGGICSRRGADVSWDVGVSLATAPALHDCWSLSGSGPLRSGVVVFVSVFLTVVVHRGRMLRFVGVNTNKPDW